MFFRNRTLRGEDVTLRLERKVKADLERGWLPSWRYFIVDPVGRRVGRCDLRIGHNENSYFAGNIGYVVDEAHRGRRYAQKASRLLFALAGRLGMEYLLITCDPDNLPSRKTCEALGGELLEIAELPADNEMRKAGSTHKCIFRYKLR